MARPVVYVSARCKHSRQLVELIERAGVADAYTFVNVDQTRRIPKFVDRIPLMVYDNQIFTDDALFELFLQPQPQPQDPQSMDVDPADNLCSGNFSETYSLLDGSHSGQRLDTCWRLDQCHEKIDTPESKPFPEKGK